MKYVYLLVCWLGNSPHTIVATYATIDGCNEARQLVIDATQNDTKFGAVCVEQHVRP